MSVLEFDDEATQRLLAVYTTHDVVAQRGEFAIALGARAATHLPLDGAGCDAAISTQVLEYVDDVDAAIGELFRVVRPGGRALIVDTDWDSIVWNASDPDRMNRVLLAWEQHVPHPHLPRELPRRLRRVGFRIESQEVLPLFNPTFVQESYSNRTIDLIQSYVASRAGISRSEASMWAQDIRATGERGEYFFSLNRYLFLVSRP